MGCNSSKASSTAKPETQMNSTPPKTLLEPTSPTKVKARDSDAMEPSSPMKMKATDNDAAEAQKTSLQVVPDAMDVDFSLEDLPGEQAVSIQASRSTSDDQCLAQINAFQAMPQQAISLDAWPEYTGPSSRIIKSPQDWCDRGILIPHECFRWLHSAMRCALANFDPLEPGQDWKTPLFFNWLERYYIPALHHHHDAEENIYNPAIVAKGGKLPEKITTDHKDIIEGLEQVAGFRTKLMAGSEVALSEFKAHLSSLIDDIEDHLAEEEEAYPAALRSSGMTEAEERAVVDKIIQSLGLDGNKIFLPSIVYAMHMWAGKEAVDQFVNALPPPIRLAFNRCWLPDFRANNLAVLRALQGNEPFVPKQPSCEVCTLM